MPLYFYLIALVPFLLGGIKILLLYITFKDSAYKIVSGNSFLKTVFDKGNFGEFLTFSYLEKLGAGNKLMTNLYIPKEDGTTTEIDLIMLSHTGIYVFESKNYSGWIFGDEKNRSWTQTLENKQKNRFFNPIWQNKAHITALKLAVGIENDSLYKSYIVFSERCTLKKINVVSPNIKVIKRNQLNKTIKAEIKKLPQFLTTEEIVRLYSKLQKYTHTDAQVKEAHIDNIKNRRIQRGKNG